jgi:pimeloyl-ACP methyl ester carboxylesterase
MTANGRPRRLTIGGASFGLLIAVSSVIRSSHGARNDATRGNRAAVVNTVNGAVITSRPIRLAFREYAPPASDRAEAAIVLIHGSPGSKEDFVRLAGRLAEHYRVIVPDLPGFGASEHSLPDYSFRAHGVYIEELLDQLGIDRVHVVGFSMGGGVALSLTDIAPRRVASLTLLSAIGVQEMELTGNYYVNHFVHGVQLGAVWLVREAAPHMGLLDKVPYSVAYARNFLDSDQRPLRNALRSVQVPTLIVHGTNDDRVPIEAAKEHARLVPQSAFEIVEGDHFLVFSRVSTVGDLMVRFLNRVESGDTVSRATATPERVRASLPLFTSAPLPRARGIATVVFGLLLTTLSLVSKTAGAAMAILLIWHGRITPWLGLIVFGAAELLRRVSTYRGRRLLLSSWCRLTRWEFWPPWVFYPPLLAYVAFLMLRHRSVTVFTCANPGIVAGGFVGESKFDILQRLNDTREFVARSRLIAGHTSPADRLRVARQFMIDERLDYPVIIKPDQGQRGSGVVVVRTPAALEDSLARSKADTILQEFVDGREFGVFYYRYPTEPSGHIFSITDKQFPAVIGDGIRTLDELIFEDERAVCAARVYRARHRTRLFDVPAAGELVPLVELGTHCRGALFLDGGWIRTPALEQRFDAIARQFDGFFFGRFDVRVDGGIDAFREGRGFKVIELNGVTSEATHIYHPGTPICTAYQVLGQQWRIAFEIGAANRRRGCPPTRISRLIELLREYRWVARHHLEPSPASSSDLSPRSPLDTIRPARQQSS